MTRSLLTGCLVLLMSVAASAQDLDRACSSLGSPDPRLRRGARAELARAGEAALGALKRGLSSDDPLVAAASADLVGELGLRAARDELHALLTSDGTPGLVVRSVCRALGAVGDIRDLPALLARAIEIPEAAVALARIGSDRALPPLRERVAAEGSTPEAAYALAALGDPQGLTLLVAGLRSGSDVRAASLRWLRAHAGKDLGTDPVAWETWLRREELARRIGDPDWEASERAYRDVLAVDRGSARFEEIFGDLLELATDPDQARPARTKAVLALGRLGRRDAAPVVLSLLERDADPQVRQYAAEALGTLAVPATAVDLAAYLIFDEEPFRKLSLRNPNQPYFTIDSEVCKSLVEMGIAGGLDFMIRQLGEERRIRVYHEAIRLLRRVSGTEFGFRPDAPQSERLEAAERWRAWFDENRSELALSGRTDLRDPAFRRRVAALVDRLDHFKFLYMSRARETLILLGEAAQPELVAGLARPEQHVRIACAEILGRIHAKRTRGAIAALLSDDQPQVRTAAAAALAEMGPGDAVAYILDALEDDSADVRIEAAHALARAEFDLAVPALKRSLTVEGTTDTFRREALYALAAQGLPEAVDDLAGLLAHRDVAFRAVVAARLRELTGRDPGIAADGIAAWRDWWEVSRKAYRGFRRDGEPR